MLYDEKIPQRFELATLLFEPISQETVPFKSFQARFQSFVDQISSYLHSSVKDGFFTHFFLGIFSTLLDTKLNNELNIKNIFYDFDNQGNLKIAVKLLKNGVEEAKFFVFSEKNEVNISGANLFIENDLEKIELLKNIPETQKKFTWVKINKNIRDAQESDNESTSKIKIETNDIKIKKSNNYPVSEFKKITKKLENESILENYIEKLYSDLGHEDEYKKEIENSFEKIMRYIKNVFDGLGLSGKSEAEHHGFLAGIFDNFRYRYNTRIYLEQFAGRGYADIILLVRGPDRKVCSIPIIIELKAGSSGNEVTAKSALKQAEGYVYGCQLKKMRLATSAEDILCMGLNLDLQDSFKTNLVSIQQQELFPVIKNIFNVIYEQDNQNEIDKKIREHVSKEYLSLPPTSEKSDAHYLGLFFLGQSLLLDQVLRIGIKKHVFIKNPEKYSERFTRKKPSKEIVFSDKSSLVSMAFMPKNNHEKLVLLNIVVIHENEDKNLAKNLESDIKINISTDLYDNSLKDKKIVDVKLTFDLRKKQNNKTLIENFLFTSVKIFKTHTDYISREINYFNGEPKVIISENELIESLNKALHSQKDIKNKSKQSDKLASSYKYLLNKIGVSVYNFKSLLRREAHFQAILHGFFDYYSDIKSKEGVRELVLTEFQTGSGDRIDMMIQIIGVSQNDINKYEEYIPVGLELKYISENPSEVQINELKEQMNRYAAGTAIKSITDGRKIAVIGVVFCNNAPDGNSLISMYEGDETIRTLAAHSSIMLPFPGGVNALTQNLSAPGSQPPTGGGGRSGTEPDAPWDERMVVRT